MTRLTNATASAADTSTGARGRRQRNWRAVPAREGYAVARQVLGDNMFTMSAVGQLGWLTHAELET